MSLSLQSPEDVCNDALIRIGWKGARIGSLYDGTEASKKALDIYGQTRDELLRSDDWGFAERNLPLALIKSAPPGGYFNVKWSNIYPILPWRFEYDYPGDALKVRSIRRTPTLLPDYDPKAIIWRVANDPTVTLVDGQQVLLCNVPDAILVYTAQVTNPIDWEPLFIELLCGSLGRRLAPALTGLEAAKVEAGDEAAEQSTAAGREG